MDAGAGPGEPVSVAGSPPVPVELPDGLAEMVPGPQLSAALAGLDPRRLTGHQLAVLVAARNRQIAYEHSQLLLAVRELGYAPPKERSAVVRDQNQNAFATVEAAFAASWTQYRAERTMQLARFTIDQVPALGQALAAGQLDLDKVKVFYTLLVGVVDEELMRTIVDLALPTAADQTTTGLRARLQRIIATLDPDAVRKRRDRDHDERMVIRHPESSGLVTLVGRFCDPAAATAAYEHVDAIARATHTAGDPRARTIDQLRTDIFLDLLAGLDPATAGYATPAERKGVITVHVNLATLIGLRGLTGADGPGGLAGLLGQAAKDPTGPGGLGWLAGHARSGDGQCRRCRLRMDDLADQVKEPGEIAGFGPVTAQIARDTVAQLAAVSRWRYAVDDDGQLIAEGALTTHALPELAEQMRRWAVDATAGADGRAHYRPTAAQIAFVRARDRRCQAPGCRVPARRCQVDHRIPWAKGGPTFIDNLYCLCKRHHRAKDEGGYTYHPVPGGMQWTTPAGRTYLKRQSHIDQSRRRHRDRRRGPTLHICSAHDIRVTVELDPNGHAQGAAPPPPLRR
jgi:Domain of unknown function (DUF222)/HNH endonuclease